jgi:hypothetical protein
MGIDIGDPQAITGEALAELEEKRRKARERQAKHRAKKKAKAEANAEHERYKRRARVLNLVPPGDVDPIRPIAFARTLVEAIPSARLWMRALGLDDIHVGETLRNARGRIYEALRRSEDFLDYRELPLLNLSTGRFDSEIRVQYRKAYSLDEEWPRVPGDDEPIDTAGLPALEPLR